jgi:hypothetical protein
MNSDELRMGVSKVPSGPHPLCKTNGQTSWLRSVNTTSSLAGTATTASREGYSSFTLRKLFYSLLGLNPQVASLSLGLISKEIAAYESQIHLQIYFRMCLALHGKARAPTAASASAAEILGVTMGSW